MPEDEIKKILSKFTIEDFDIVGIVNNGLGETRVIIKFIDIESAE